MKQKLELALSVLVIIFAVFLVIGFLRSGLAPWDHPLIPEVAHPGDILPPIAGLNANPGQTTLIVAIRKGCEFCEASMPFYRRLEDLEKEHKLKPRLLAVLPGSEATAGSFLAAHHLGVAFAAGVPLERIHVAGTPTLIWADANRKVIHAWVGELTTAGQARLLQDVDRVQGRF